MARQTRVHENGTDVTIELDYILSIDNSRHQDRYGECSHTASRRHGSQL
ncbi:MAG: hypothetical protein WKF77_11515 [Planctomycetaceae bacterium]